MYFHLDTLKWKLKFYNDVYLYIYFLLQYKDLFDLRLFQLYLSKPPELSPQPIWMCAIKKKKQDMVQVIK